MGMSKGRGKIHKQTTQGYTKIYKKWALGFTYLPLYLFVVVECDYDGLCSLHQVLTNFLPTPTSSCLLQDQTSHSKLKLSKRK